jgi:AcrR family transcriptional regulator
MADLAETAEPHARGGRPRNPSLDEAIIIATRQRLTDDGYSRMSLGDIAADAGVSRPTLYRRWPGKFELVMDALDWGFAAQQASYPTDPLGDMAPRDAFLEAMRRLDPCYFNPDAIILQGNFMAEARRAPELLAMVSERAVQPRVRLLETVLKQLIERGHVRADLDVGTVATLCFGSFFGAFLRNGEEVDGLAERVVATLWPLISIVETPARADAESSAVERSDHEDKQPERP